MQVPCKKYLRGCRLNFPDCLLHLRFSFSTHFYEAAYGVGFARSLLSCRKLHTLPFCFPLVTNTFSSVKATYSMESIHHNRNNYGKVPSSIQRAAIQHSQVGVDFSIIPWPTSQTDAKIRRDESSSAARTSASSSCDVFLCFTDPEQLPIVPSYGVLEERFFHRLRAKSFSSNFFSCLLTQRFRGEGGHAGPYARYVPAFAHPLCEQNEKH